MNLETKIRKGFSKSKIISNDSIRGNRIDLKSWIHLKFTNIQEIF